MIVSTDQLQKAGHNSTQIQIIQTGIDEKRARELDGETLDTAKEHAETLVEETLAIALKESVAVARRTADDRMKAFEKILLFRMEPSKLRQALMEPDFFLTFRKAQASAAATERPSDYDLLSELLVQRFEKKQDRPIRVGIERAVDTVNQISDDALLGLTVIHSILCFVPESGDINKGLDKLNNFFGKILYSNLPSHSDWLEDLEALNTIKLLSIGELKKLRQYYPKRVEGYIAVGIKKDSTNHEKAIKLLANISLPENVLVEHTFNSDYIRLAISKRKYINKICVEGIVDENFLSTNGINDAQKETLYSIYDLYENDEVIINQNIDKLMEEWGKREYLKIIKNWWDNINTGIQITSSGRYLAHANAQRCDKDVPSSLG